MNVESYYKSLTVELESLKDRVRNFIQGAHWLTDGEWKESVLRSMLGRKLPDTVKVGRGFVLTPHGPTTQCDILIYKASSPILFREGELVFLTTDSVLGIIEVKSSANRQVLESALDKFAEIGRKLGSHRAHCFFALFSYECQINDDADILEVLRRKCDHETKIIDMLSLGRSTFVRWWKYTPEGGTDHYERWHAYNPRFVFKGLGALHGVFGSRPIAYSSRLGNASPSGLADARLMLVLPSSAAVNLPARHASKLQLTLMVTRPCAVLLLVPGGLQVLVCSYAIRG